MSKRQNKWILGEMTVEEFKSQECTRQERSEAEEQLSPEQGQLGPQELTNAGDGVAVKDGEHSITFSIPPGQFSFSSSSSSLITRINGR